MYRISTMRRRCSRSLSPNFVEVDVHFEEKKHHIENFHFHKFSRVGVGVATFSVRSESEYYVSQKDTYDSCAWQMNNENPPSVSWNTSKMLQSPDAF